MADYTDNALLASIKALEKVVLPAVNPEDPLAGEQLRLVTGFLKFLRGRLPYWHHRCFFELNHNLALAELVVPDAREVNAEVSARLDNAIDMALQLRAQQSPALDAVGVASQALAEAVSGLVRALPLADAERQRRVEKNVLAASKRWVDMQRAWFLPQGFEMNPDELPSLEYALKGIVQ